MDLILWRHAEAHDHPDTLLGRQGDPLDLARRLTPRGEKQAARMATWLDRQLPAAARVLTSPAQRAEQTALALGRKYKVREELAPQGEPHALLELVQWPFGKSPVVVVGHQPTLGRVVAHLLGLAEADCPVRKGAIWWLRYRERDGVAQTVLVTVQTPELL
ncbi:MAG: histidine phosphatase family protein [Hydrogenophaga sp.]|uniref:SixA phosphatase family protein n=1 Tax=Hydrogenophaga sp. TaxID=1904254 RepID=UPI001BBABC2B|nr:histidine phosphatase family protein [Hydrogenophaga sp.]MBS3911093.1 histidine phosphatase family protein [Hydrogenophaga sp.]MDO9147276.1 histidine phosphatase family protein [Hydrogenophaga sp.]MDO9604822.1 histidine phosphatase family protein [Hydrogenophaga sp.]